MGFSEYFRVSGKTTYSNYSADPSHPPNPLAYFLAARLAFFSTAISSLESLRLLKHGTWALQREKGLPIREANKSGLGSEANAEPAYPDRYKLLAVHAYERGELSEKEVANCLQCDIWDARRIVQESMLSFEVDSEGHLHSVHADFETSLLIDNS